MTKKSSAAAKKVTLQEFRAAFKGAFPWAGKDIGLGNIDKGLLDLKRKLEQVFPSRKLSASVSIKAFNDHADAVIGAKRSGKTGRFAMLDESASSRFYSVHKITERMPTLCAAFKQEGKLAEEKRERARKREEARESREAARPRTLSERVDTLERENAALREQLSSRPPSPEEDRRIREWYEKNDSRIGGSHDPDPPGFRD